MNYATTIMTANDDLPRYVLDASVAAKWYLRDEDGVESADSLLADFREDRTQLIAPDQIRYEVPRAIRNASRTNRVTVGQARQAMAGFLSWQIPTVGDDALVLAAYDQATRFGCSLYDGLHLAATEASECPLIYADDRLRTAIGTRFPLASWLADYVPQGDTERGRRDG